MKLSLLFAHVLPAVLLLAAFPVAAAPTCSPSTSIKHFDYPGASAIVTTNNLILPTGKALEADGQKLIITGRVVDRNCMPVPEAMTTLDASRSSQAIPLVMPLPPKTTGLASARVNLKS